MRKKDLSFRHILLVDMSLELLSFLIEKNVLTKFMNNAVRTFTPYRRSRDFRDYFVWAHTPEGWKFWNELYVEYGCHPLFTQMLQK